MIHIVGVFVELPDFFHAPGLRVQLFLQLVHGGADGGGAGFKVVQREDAVGLEIIENLIELFEVGGLAFLRIRARAPLGVVGGQQGNKGRCLRFCKLGFRLLVV